MSSATVKVVWLTVAVIGAAGAGGCVQPQPLPSDQFLDDWARRMDTMGLVPVMPPREDVRVGDMFAFRVNPQTATAPQQRGAAARDVAAVTRWGSLPVLSELADEYRQRPSWPKTPDAFLLPKPAGAATVWEEPQTRGTRSIFDPDEVPTRLRIVGVELFTTVSFTSANLENIIPTEAATLITGRAGPDDMAVTLRVGSAESYALSLISLIPLLVEPISGVMDGRYRLRQPYRDQLDFIADPIQNRVWLQVVTEVLYIRSADISIRTKGETPLNDDVTASELVGVATALHASSAPAEPRGDASPASSEPGQASSGPVPVEPPAGTSPASSEPGQAADEEPSGTAQLETATAENGSDLKALAATKLDPIYAAFVRANAINELLQDMDSDDAPGGTTRFLSVTDESVALRRVWPRGLAIGMRGLYLEVDAATGDVLRSGTLRRPAGVSVTP